jgi:hypothetical protein
VILGITLGVLIALVIIEFLGRPPSPEIPEVAEPASPADAELSDAPSTAAVPVDSSEANDAAEADVRS